MLNRYRFAALVAAALVSATPSAAQLPGAPVLQNAFSNPGITVAGNFAAGEATSLAAIALAWAPGTGRFQFSAGVGGLTPDEGDRMTSVGARLGVPLLSLAGGSIGIAPFAGVGGASQDTLKLLQIPVGVGAGWRRALGVTRALSIYATATYLYARTELGAERTTDWLPRAALAADVTVVRNLGLTAGYEAGAKADAGEAGPRGDIFGVGLSWSFR